MQFLNSPLIIPLGAIVMVVFLMAFDSIKGVRENEIHAYCDLRVREMEHLRRIKELEVEHARATNHTSN